MSRLLPSLSLIAAALLLTGCGSGDQKVKVSGKVTLDEKPMADGEITFSLPGQVPSTIPVKNGTYQGEAKVGKNRVEVRAYRLGKPNPMYKDQEPPKENYLPARYNTESTFTAEVTAAGPNEFNFEVKSK